MSVSIMTKPAMTMRLASGDWCGQVDAFEASKDWMHFDRVADKPVNENERTSLAALISYVAFVSGKSEFCVEREFADRFKIPNPRCLPSCLFDKAIRYLVELAPAA